MLFGDDFFGEADDNFFSGLDGAGEHEADGVKELHAGLVEVAGGGEGDDFGEGAEEHRGRSYLGGDGGELRVGWCPGFGDGFFDERLFDAGAHVAGGELDEVFDFVGSGAAEEIEEEAEFGRGATGIGKTGEGGFDVGEGEGGGSGGAAIEEGGGGGSGVGV